MDGTGFGTGFGTRFTGDSGAVLIEAVLVMPVFFLLLFGIIDYSEVLRDYQTVNHMVQVGARTVGVHVSEPDADFDTIRAMRAASLALPGGRLRRVVIWRASADGSGNEARRGPSSVVPAGCRSAAFGNAADRCNVYSASAGTLNPGDDDRPTWSDCDDVSNPARFWCANTRKTAAQGSAGPPDMAGIYVEMVRPFTTGLFGPAITIAQQGVVQLETTSLQ